MTIDELIAQVKPHLMDAPDLPAIRQILAPLVLENERLRGLLREMTPRAFIPLPESIECAACGASAPCFGDTEEDMDRALDVLQHAPNCATLSARAWLAGRRGGSADA